MKRPPKSVFALLAASAFLLYLSTLAPGVLYGDGGEFQFAAWNFSFVHPTGYPLFLTLGGLFQHIVPLGNPAFRLNLLNAIFAALAVGMLFLALDELVQNRAAAITAAAAFALTRTFWFQATGAEVYALHALFVASLLWLALVLKVRPTARLFAVWFLILGFALTHHRTIVLWLPAFGALYWIGRDLKFRPSSRQVVLLAACLVLPLLLYMYVPLRAPSSPYSQLSLAPGSTIVTYDDTLQGFVNYVLGRTFETELAWDARSWARLASVPRDLLTEFGLVGVLVGVLGLGAIVRRREWALLALLGLGFVATAFFSAVYHIGDIEGFNIPAYLVWAVWIGVGLALLIRYLSRQMPVPLSILLAVSVVVPQFYANYGVSNRSRDTAARERWTKILASPLPESTILLSNDRDEMMPMWYIQYVERTRTDLLGLFPLITPAPEHANIARLTDRALESNRPVYFTKPMPGLEIKYRLEPTRGSLVRVQGHTVQMPSMVVSSASVAGRIRVQGYDAIREGTQVRIAIYWEAQSELDRDLTSFVHLADAQGLKVAQGDDHQVGGDFYPTRLWRIGETLRDEHIVSVEHLTQGVYRLFVGMYSRPGSLRIAMGSLEPFGEAVEIGVVMVE